MPVSVMAARWMVSRWVSTPMTTWRGDVTIGGVLSVAMNRAVGDNPVGRADKTSMRNGQAPD
jgi:hypothetical protein